MRILFSTGSVLEEVRLQPGQTQGDIECMRCVSFLTAFLFAPEPEEVSIICRNRITDYISTFLKQKERYRAASVA